MNYILTSNDGWRLVSNNKKPIIDRNKQKIEKNMKEKDGENIKKENFKKILCKNIVGNNKCVYDAKCLYAHSVDEQKIDDNRKQAYDIIKSQTELSSIDLYKNKTLYTNLQTLTKLCLDCERGICTGGYNCKHGAFTMSYVVCNDDLNKGKCEDVNCKKVHLTSRGLIPYMISMLNNTQKAKNTKNVVEKIDMLETFMSLNDTPKMNNAYLLQKNDKYDDNEYDDELYESSDDDNENMTIIDMLILGNNNYNIKDLYNKQDKINKSIFNVDMATLLHNNDEK
jgi:hypothetical protein